MTPFIQPIRSYGLVLLLAIIVASCANLLPRQARENQFSDLEGYYVAGPLAVTEVVAVEGFVAVRPPQWGGRPYFAPSIDNRFVMTLPHTDTDRWVEFSRDLDGSGTSLRFNELHSSFDGIEFIRLQDGDHTPAQFFFDRHPELAAQTALRNPQITVEQLYEFTAQQFIRYPSRRDDSIRFMEILRDQYPDHVGFTALLGLALVSVGDRVGALEHSQAALQAEPDNDLARETIRRLTMVDPAPGEGYRAVLPFRLSAAHARPTASEIRNVRNIWPTRNLEPAFVNIESEYTTEISGIEYRIQIIRHELNGETHYGAAFIPAFSRGLLPVIIDARGVNPDYSPMNIDDGTQLMRAMGDAENHYIFLVPAMNGHTLEAGGVDYVSTGDPSDAWDGATDATIGFLNAALSTISNADQQKIAAFGHSRGSTVALLAGIRDPRISLVLSVSGPVDHFQAMNSYLGWTSAELLADSMSDGLPPTLEEEGGQDFDHFFDRVLTDGETLAEVRLRLLASSPLYFADNLPETHVFFGADDRSVPVENARLLREAMENNGLMEAGSTLRLYPDLGHDTDSLHSWRDSRNYLEAWADMTPSEH
ncbi:MAG: hypothetical protein DHS20C06_07870 [Hyphobacterium sp.]|nr:MAG: hypothetical protein DHS20C06_07870 [Hyphobacterium sp.]